MCLPFPTDSLVILTFLIRLKFEPVKTFVYLSDKICVSNSQGRNQGCLVSSTRTSSISNTQGIGLGREPLRYLTNTDDSSSIEL